MQIAEREYYWLPVDITMIEQRILDRLRTELRPSPEYVGAVKERFDWLTLCLVRFLGIRMNAPNSLCPYLAPFGDGSKAPVEADLEADLFLHLRALGAADIQKIGPAGGKTDILLPQGGFNFMVENKRTFDEWDVAVAGFLGQAVAYQQADVKLGSLAILDLTKRDAGVPDFEQCFEVRERQIAGEKPRYVLVMRVPGNRMRPSDMSR